MEKGSSSKSQPKTGFVHDGNAKSSQSRTQGQDSATMALNTFGSSNSDQKLRLNAASLEDGSHALSSWSEKCLQCTPDDPFAGIEKNLEPFPAQSQTLLAEQRAMSTTARQGSAPSEAEDDEEVEASGKKSWDEEKKK